MDYPTFFLLLSFFLTLTCVVTINGRRNSRLPPGPFPLPIIGNLLKLSYKPHHSLATLSKLYGPLMSLKFGSKTTIVVSSPDIAKEFLQTHDQSFSSRSISNTCRTTEHVKYSIVLLPAGDKWRKLRRITKEYLFSTQCLDANEHLRKDKVQELLDHVNHCCTSEKAVRIGEVVFTTTLNILSNFMFSMDIAHHDSVSSQEFKHIARSLMEIAGKPNLADFFPILEPFDIQGLVRRGNVYSKKLLTIFDSIINQRLQTRSSSSSYENFSSTNKDVLDSLLDLSLKNDSELSRNDMRHLFMALYIAGTDTTSSTIEWAMTELIRNPQKMEVVRSEVIELMQNKDRNIEEQDIPQLRYLQAVIKETLRLHPPAPLLIPHEAITDSEVQGYIVPKNAQILFNVWAMGRDPKVWSDPETFMPERFLDVKMDYKGQDFEFIPFGAGRRICPGLNIAHRMLHVILGSLVQKFDWKLEGNMKPQNMEIGEKFGMTLQRSVPLISIPKRL